MIFMFYKIKISRKKNKIRALNKLMKKMKIIKKIYKNKLIEIQNNYNKIMNKMKYKMKKKNKKI